MLFRVSLRFVPYNMLHARHSERWCLPLLVMSNTGVGECLRKTPVFLLRLFY